MTPRFSWPGQACRLLSAPRWQSTARRFLPQTIRQFRSAVAPPGWRSSTGIEVVQVSCGSIDPVYIFLHNMQKFFEEDTSLFVYLPPHPTFNRDEPPAPELPRFLQDHPTVTIGYRWFPDSSGSRLARTILCWPTPVHDVGFAWQWIRENLCPEKPPPGKSNAPRRNVDVNVVGAYRGAGLAVSLAINSSFPRPEFGIRKVMAYNGIYNWSMFLPEHRIHRLGEITLSDDHRQELMAARELGDEQLAVERRNIAGLFDDKPAHLFDPFASPSLFYISEDINAPRSFDGTEEENDKDVLRALARNSPAPRRSRLVHPPSRSLLAIPEAHLFYTPLSSPFEIEGKSDRAGVNCYEQQAKQLVHLMRRGVMRKEVEPQLFHIKDGTPEYDQVSSIPSYRVRCDPLTDNEYDEISLVVESGQ